MSIENIKNAKFKKITLIILLMFAIMVILPGFISSLATKVNAYRFKSISKEKEYDTDAINAGLGIKLYGFLSEYVSKNKELPEYDTMKENRLRIGWN